MAQTFVISDKNLFPDPWACKTDDIVVFNNQRFVNVRGQEWQPEGIREYTVETLPNPATLAPGTTVFVGDYGGNSATAVGGVWRFEFPFRTTWDNRPPVNLVQAGTEVSVTDCGGAIAVATAIGWSFRPIDLQPSTTIYTVSGATSTAEQTVFSIIIPGMLLGTKGTFSVGTYVDFPVSSNTKTFRTRLDGVGLSQLSTLPAHRTAALLSRIKNFSRSSQKNMDGQIFNYGTSGGGVNTSSIDTSVDTTFSMTLQLASSAETATFHGYTATIHPGM